MDSIRILLAAFFRLFLDAAAAASQETTSWWGDLKQGMIDVAAEVIQKLPESPIVKGLDLAGDFPIEEWMPFVNWFIPFRTLLTILGFWLSAVALYYLVQIVLRWVKVIE